MAAFPSRDRAVFDAHWATNILGNPSNVTRTILVDGKVAGNIGRGSTAVCASSATGSAGSTGAKVSRPGRSPLSCTL